MSEASAEPLRIAVLGGTGPQGKGLALRLAMAGYPVVLGSRDPVRAEEVAAELRSRHEQEAEISGLVSGAGNADAAGSADVVIVAVPWAGHGATVASLREELAGKVVIDCVNPLGFDKKGAFALDVPEGSAAQQAESLLPDSRVVAAFHHVSAVLLNDLEVREVDTDVLVLGDDREATDLVQGLADGIPGMRGIYGGRLRNARQVEALTANLIAMNRRYKVHAGVRITDV